MASGEGIAGLRYRHRKGGRAAYWIATKEAVAAGYEPRCVRLHGETDAEIVARCQRLQSEMLLWLSRGQVAPTFDRTFASLLDRYLADPESSFARLKPSARHPYQIYAGKLRAHIGERRIDAVDGRDVQRWFKVWAGVDNLKHPDARLPRARTTLSVLKAAVAFGVMCRLAGCAEFAAVLRELEFPQAKPRAFAPTAAQIEAVRAAAHAAGAPSRALAYAIQYETSLRQWDVIGQWLPLSDWHPSAVLSGRSKWIGPTWEMVDANLVLRITPTKTEDSSAAAAAYDLTVCPMVMAELAHVINRQGALIVNERTGLPYEYDQFKAGWKADFKAAGLDPKIWNRDLRAGAITEAGIHGAATDDRRKVAGHTTDRMVAQVYDRDRLEAHRRVAAARLAGRKKDAD